MADKITRREFIKTGTLAGLGFIAGCSVKNRFDLIIKNGLIIDGSAPMIYPVDLGIKRINPN